MYDPLETSISREQMAVLLEKCRQKKIKVAIIGGWATYFHVNEIYRRAFGKDYMGSRDIDIFVDSLQENIFAEIIDELGFKKDGSFFRYEKIYDREKKIFVSTENANPLFNMIYIFLDVFSDAKTQNLGSWSNLEPLKKIKVEIINGMEIADIDTLLELKCVSIFARDKADKENKDACDIYSLLFYSGKDIKSTIILKKAIEKIKGRNDLLYYISEHVLRDPAKQSIASVALTNLLKNKFA